MRMRAPSLGALSACQRSPIATTQWGFFDKLSAGRELRPVLQSVDKAYKCKNANRNQATGWLFACGCPAGIALGFYGISRRTRYMVSSVPSFATRRALGA